MMILGIPGSLRRDSYNRRLLKAASALAPGLLTIWDGLATVPPFDEDVESTPPRSVKAMRAAIAEADGVLIASPEYNGSVPGQLKNALDWASRPPGGGVLRDKPVAVIGASPSPGGAARAQTEIRAVLERCRAVLVQRGLAVGSAYRQFDDDGRLVDPALRKELAAVLADLLAVARPPDLPQAA
jgi:chromate reductase, NAD(P)H dehydrogenase (quinone)